MALKHDVFCKFCHSDFQIDDLEAHNLTMMGEKPICSDACFDGHYNDDCKCGHCKIYRARGKGMNLADPCRDCGKPWSYLCAHCSVNSKNGPVCTHCCPNQKNASPWSCGGDE